MMQPPPLQLLPACPGQHRPLRTSSPPSKRRRNGPSNSAAADWSTTSSPGRCGGPRRRCRSRPSGPSWTGSGGKRSVGTSDRWTRRRPSAKCLPRPPAIADRTPLHGPREMRPRPERSTRSGHRWNGLRLAEGSRSAGNERQHSTHRQAFL